VRGRARRKILMCEAMNIDTKVGLIMANYSPFSRRAVASTATRRRTSSMQEAWLKTMCPTCSAPIGVRCRAENNASMKWAHSERRTPALREAGEGGWGTNAR
jgi:anaerobic selenocysteine-containing dehydrogenase